jgi:diguanylate cyclase (GGDEF)-like protein
VHLRAALRHGIVSDIQLVLERDTFLRRLAELVAQTSGRPMVALYLRIEERGGFVLSGRTSETPSRLPARMLPPAGDAHPALDELELPDFSGMRRLTRLLVPIAHERAVIGYLAVLADEPGFHDAEHEVFKVVAAEIAPAIAVADRHHVIQRACVVDQDTGAYTFDFFTQRLTEELSRAKRTGHSVTILLVEPVNYNEFERSAGYERGDQVLRALADDFAAVMRISDVVSRRGRTGYAVLLPESDVSGAQVAITRIRRRLARLSDQLKTAGLGEASPRFAIGTASYPADDDDAATLLLIAEQRQFEDETTLSLLRAS